MFRILIFTAANFGILLVMGIVFQIIGLDIFLIQTSAGFNTTGVMAFAACFGFGGAFVSLALSKFMAKRGMRVQIIESPSNQTERWLVETSGFFLLWRLCLYGATVCGWVWMRRRLLARESGMEARRRLLRAEVAGVVGIVALEASLLMQAT